METAELVGALRARTNASLDALKLHYGPLIRYVIAPILTDQRDREECFSDVLLRVWDRIGQYDPRAGSFPNWLSAIARNAAVDRARRMPPAGEELTEAIPSPEGSPEQELLRRERQQALYAALRQLSRSDQAVFYRKYYYRQSTAQIAAELGSTERAIEGKLYRIKRKLRRELGGVFYE